jgi:membrane protease YdiL (CAAX protease family)
MDVAAASRGRLLGWITLVAALATLNYGARFAGGKPPDDALYRWDTAVGGLVQYTLIFSFVLWIAHGLPKRLLFALRRPNSWKQAAGSAFLVLLGIVVLSAALSPILHAGEEQGLTPDRWEPSRAVPFFANFAVIAGAGPVVEELAFRGLGFTLLERFGRTTAILLVGLAFGLAHGLLEALPILVAFGSGLAYLRSRTGSVYPGIALHAVFNAVALTLAVAA